jgi:hypothetical protein
MGDRRSSHIATASDYPIRKLWAQGTHDSRDTVFIRDYISSLSATAEAWKLHVLPSHTQT